MDAQNFKKLCPKVLDFLKILKLRKQILSNPRIFCLLLFYIVQREPSTMIYVGFIIKIISIYF